MKIKRKSFGDIFFPSLKKLVPKPISSMWVEDLHAEFNQKVDEFNTLTMLVTDGHDPSKDGKKLADEMIGIAINHEKHVGKLPDWYRQETWREREEKIRAKIEKTQSKIDGMAMGNG